MQLPAACPKARTQILKTKKAGELALPGFCSTRPKSLPYIVGEVAARKRGRRGAEGLRFFGKMRKPPTPLRRLLRRRHLPCAAGEARAAARAKPGAQRRPLRTKAEAQMPRLFSYRFPPAQVEQAAGNCIQTQFGARSAGRVEQKPRHKCLGFSVISFCKPHRRPGHSPLPPAAWPVRLWGRL